MRFFCRRFRLRMGGAGGRFARLSLVESIRCAETMDMLLTTLISSLLLNTIFTIFVVPLVNTIASFAGEY